MNTTKTPLHNAANLSVKGSGTFSCTRTESSSDVAGSGVTLEPTLNCYCRGTLIRTVSGDTPIEALRVGDCVVAASGEVRPVRWIGSRRLDCTRHPNPLAVWPIHIQAGAFGQGLPARDLWVSPFHSILVDGLLIRAETLVNDATIRQVPSARVEYWHVELDCHDILLAEGLPGASYLDAGNRTALVNDGAFVEAHPDFKPKHLGETCVPLVRAGQAVQSAEAALFGRAFINSSSSAPNIPSASAAASAELCAATWSTNWSTHMTPK
jgi:hypothetical protein